jgi:hypothetical protein
MFDLHDLAVEFAIEVVLVVIGDDSQNFPRVIDAIEGHHILRTHLETAAAADAGLAVDVGEIEWRVV